ncbi:MAG TPA: P1 family peptidase [Acidobacteriota bacterium]|nr:P1 family peptidase [Acidobacteriota bacterium]
MTHFDINLMACVLLIPLLFCASSAFADDTPKRARARDLGIVVGTMDPGARNAITDVPGVAVGHQTIIRGANVRTGVTAILPHKDNLYQDKVPAAIFVGNGFGKLAGYTQVAELGNIETPIVLTNTLSVATALTAVVEYTLAQPGNEDAQSVNAVVGETNDSYLNDIRGLHVSPADVRAAIAAAASGAVAEGCVGAGTGTRAFGFKGGIGTASRLVRLGDDTTYVLGVLVQTNYGGILEINGAPVGRELARRRESADSAGAEGGSCMVVVATDAPLSDRNLERVAARTMHGLARTGSYMSNGSGDYAIAFSTAYRISHGSRELVPVPPLIPNNAMTPFFRAAIEATQEAVYNSLLTATTTTGREGRVVEAVPVDAVVRICEKHGVLNSD